ncbi:7405_t:CDS:2 [Funneliformis mosseae]|uniref:7405_t:CDS:1 n=2 Tax=Funneliformis TaxID=1117308 RepID=A0A9N8ZR58_FUNMO|nr:7405_t:CDS:2 [Funneliformis mosseae]
MYFQGYELQVLISDIMLKEYLGPRKNVPYRYTSPNWVDNCQTGIRMESEFLHYILIPSSSTPFAIQVSSSKATFLKPIVAEIRIDGIPIQETASTTSAGSSLNPKGLNLVGSGKKQQICVLDKNEDKEQQLIGAISVFFYKAESLLQRKSEIPLAILHLHYRSKDIISDLIQNRFLKEDIEGFNDEEKEKKDLPIEQEQVKKIYNSAYGEEPLRQFQNEMTEQVSYDYDVGLEKEYQRDVWDQPRNMEIIEILDD